MGNVICRYEGSDRLLRKFPVYNEVVHYRERYQLPTDHKHYCGWLVCTVTSISLALAFKNQLCHLATDLHCHVVLIASPNCTENWGVRKLFGSLLSPCSPVAMGPGGACCVTARDSLFSIVTCSLLPTW